MHRIIMRGSQHRRALEAATEALGPRPKQWRATRGFVLLVVAVAVVGGIVVYGARASGQEMSFDSPVGDARPEDPPRRAVIDVEGYQGIWFALPVAREMLADLEELPVLRDRVRLLESRASIRDTQVERLQRSVELAQVGEGQALEAAHLARDALQESEATSRVWWRSPVLWVAVGTVLGAVMVGLAAKVLDWSQLDE